MKQSLAHGTRQYDSFVSASHSNRSFSAYHRKIHTIYRVGFTDDVIPLGLQARLFERAPKEVLLPRAEEQIVDLPGLVQSFAVGQNERDPAQPAAGNGVGKLDQADLPGGFPQPLHIADRWYAEELFVFPVKV